MQVGDQSINQSTFLIVIIILSFVDDGGGHFFVNTSSLKLKIKLGK